MERLIEKDVKRVKEVKTSAIQHLTVISEPMAA
jgi:hypothetical protein